MRERERKRREKKWQQIKERKNCCKIKMLIEILKYFIRLLPS